MGRVDEVPQKAVSVVQATTSQVSLGSVVPLEKLKLGFKLLGLSSRGNVGKDGNVEESQGKPCRNE